MLEAVWVVDCPLHRLHTAKTSPHYCRPALNTEVVGQASLRIDPVAHSYDRKIGPVELARFRVCGVGAGGAVTTAQIIQADNEELVGIDRLARADVAIPPSRFLLIH